MFLHRSLWLPAPKPWAGILSRACAQKLSAVSGRAEPACSGLAGSIMDPMMSSKVSGGDGRGLLPPTGVEGRAGLVLVETDGWPREGTGGIDMRAWWLLSARPLAEVDRFAGSENCEILLAGPGWASARAPYMWRAEEWPGESTKDMPSYDLASVVISARIRAEMSHMTVLMVVRLSCSTGGMVTMPSGIGTGLSALAGR